MRQFRPTKHYLPMSEYLFLTGSGHLPKRAARIARKYGATLVNYTDPQCTCGRGCAPSECKASRRHWFAGPNRGEPFDSRLSSAVASEMKGGK